MSKVVWERKFTAEFSRSIRSHRMGWLVLMMKIKFLRTNISEAGLTDKTSSMLNKTAVKSVHKEQIVIETEKKQDTEWGEGSLKSKFLRGNF